MSNQGQSASIHLVAFVAILETIQTMSMIWNRTGKNRTEEWGRGWKCGQPRIWTDRKGKPRERQTVQDNVNMRIQERNVVLRIKTI